jgi:hypothetical protein
MPTYGATTNWVVGESAKIWGCHQLGGSIDANIWGHHKLGSRLAEWSSYLSLSKLVEGHTSKVLA